MTDQNQNAVVIFEQRRQFLQSPQVLEKIAEQMPRGFDANRFAVGLLNAISKNKDLLACAPNKVLVSAYDAAKRGLSIDPAHGEAYLSIYKDTPTLIVGYKGLLKLVRRSGEITRIAAYPVYENDAFEYQDGTESFVRHVPTWDARGRLLGFWGIAVFKDGTQHIDRMSVAEVNAIRDKSSSYAYAKDKANTIWGKHYNEMGCKTLIRKMSKVLPIEIDVAFEDHDRASFDPQTGEIIDHNPQTGGVEDRGQVDTRQITSSTPQQGSAEAPRRRGRPPMNPQPQQQAQQQPAAPAQPIQAAAAPVVEAEYTDAEEVIHTNQAPVDTFDGGSFDDLAPVNF